MATPSVISNPAPCQPRWAPKEHGETSWADDPGFLGGSAGIALALLAAATPVEPAWDRVLLLSAAGVTME